MKSEAKAELHIIRTTLTIPEMILQTTADDVNPLCKTTKLMRSKRKRHGERAITPKADTGLCSLMKRVL
jgi:hypothetical protein